MKMLKEYFALQKQIYEYFGYVEDWVTIPMNDSTDCYWYLEGDGRDDSVWFMEEKPPEGWENDEFPMTYANEIYTQRFLPKWVYRGEEYTMVCVDTQTDGNRYLQIFDNSKEMKIDKTQ